MSSPPIPQRPARSQQQQDLPQIPARPARSVERHINRDVSARSPLNIPPQESANGRAEHAPPRDLRRPPSVAALPSIGDEGQEYTALDQAGETVKPSVQQPGTTSNVASDLPLHAPRASATPLDKQRLADVTRSDSATAAAAGVGKPTTAYNEGDVSSRPRSRADRPLSAVSHSRPGSVSHSDHHEDAHGIPEIGVRVPMYRNAGDVQAPTPGSASPNPASGIGFFNGGSRPTTQDGRRRSAQGFHVPPDAYGLHGHGVGPQDQFETEWYKKHPEEREKEKHGAYGPAISSDRHEWNLSSEELNRLVHDSGKQQPGFRVGTDTPEGPSEAIGYAATDAYNLRATSPRPVPLKKVQSREQTAPHVESPLKHQTFPDGTAQNLRNDDSAHEDAVHVDAPHRSRHSRLTSRSHDGHDFAHEDTPILASDEVLKNPGGEWMAPAVSPEAERHLGDEEYFSGVDAKGVPRYETGYRSTSRSRSRQGNNRQPAGGHGLTRFVSREESGTPLREIEEYEPLFKEDDKETILKAATQADRLKRPELEKHRFPSEDIWEDTPDSLRLEAEVDTPEEPHLPKAFRPSAAAVFESPEAEAARRGDAVLQAKPKFKPGVQQQVDRPSLRHRFPSQDIWEDSPDSLQLESELAGDADAGEEDRPSVPARPARAGAPGVPEKPKPQVPQRPAKKLSESETDRAVEGSKVKPAVPARPAGGSAKFASIKADFMNDLNSRLKLGPQGPPPKKEESTVEPEKEEDAAPLGDARKSRARGPVRRKPATAAATFDAASGLTLSLFEPQTVWSISPDPKTDLLVERSKMVTPLHPPMGAQDVLVHKPEASMDARAADEEASRAKAVGSTTEEQIGFHGDVPEPAAGLAHSINTAAHGTKDGLDHTDPHVPSTVDRDAEQERQQELASIGVQTGEIYVSSGLVDDDTKNEKLTIVEGGNALTGSTVVTPRRD